jgi:4-hydroxybenzoate polyprenyltransferase
MTLAALGRLVKFSHSLFALPFAVSAAVLVSTEARLDPLRLLLVAAAVVAARTAAMAMNRIADRRIDARNPRTANRELVTGEVSIASATVLLLASTVAFIVAAAALSPLCGWLSLPVIAVLLGYSFAKRFTWAVHLWLGLAQALGPVGVAIALTGRVTPAAALLGIGVGAWVAGFDVLYSLQDLDIDRKVGLHSIPARFGARGALIAARLLHVLAAAAIAVSGTMGHMGPGWLTGSALLAVVLAAEHLYIAPSGQLRQERIAAAFFNFNALASVAFAFCALFDLTFARIGGGA